MMRGLFAASRICCWWCQRSVNSRAVSNQLADFSSPAQLTPYGAVAYGSREAWNSASDFAAASTSLIKTSGLNRRYTVTPSLLRRLMNAAKSSAEVILGLSARQPSRPMETPRNEVSSKCAATSLTFHFGETVCFSQSSGASEQRSSISIPSIFGKRCAVRMGFNGSIRRFIKCSTSEIKPVAENHLGNQVIRRTRHTHTEPKIDFPLGGEIQVNGGEDLLLLLADRVEARDRTKRAVIFESPRDFLGEIVTELEVGRENDSLIHARPMKRAVE